MRQNKHFIILLLLLLSCPITVTGAPGHKWRMLMPALVLVDEQIALKLLPVAKDFDSEEDCLNKIYVQTNGLRSSLANNGAIKIVGAFCASEALATFLSDSYGLHLGIGTHSFKDFKLPQQAWRGTPDADPFAKWDAAATATNATKGKMLLAEDSIHWSKLGTVLVEPLPQLSHFAFRLLGDHKQCGDYLVLDPIKANMLSGQSAGGLFLWTHTYTTEEQAAEHSSVQGARNKTVCASDRYVRYVH